MNQISEFLNQPLLEVGGATLTLWGVLKAVFTLVASFLVARLVAFRILSKVLSRTLSDRGIANAIATATYYALLIAGLSVLLSQIGISTTSLSVFAGALGLGLGIGLQDVAKNLVSGLVLLAARPIKPGDRIITEGLEADVEKIGPYFTSVRTVDDASVIIPNYDLLNSRLVNWTYESDARRFRIPIGVHYNSDPEQVRDVLLRVAREAPEVDDDPVAEVRLLQFGESSLDFELVVWSREMTYRPFQLRSRLNFAIHRAFRESGIEIPYPQRDVHLRSSSVPLNDERSYGHPQQASGDG